MKWTPSRVLVLVLVLGGVGGGWAVWHAARREVPSASAAALTVQHQFGYGRSACGQPRDYEPGRAGYWDYECTLGRTTGSVLIRFKDGRIADSEIIA